MSRSNKDLLASAFAFSLDILDRMRLDGNISDDLAIFMLEGLEKGVQKRLEDVRNRVQKRAEAEEAQQRINALRRSQIKG